jgi:hypothetical protein
LPVPLLVLDILLASLTGIKLGDCLEDCRFDDQLF